MGAHVWEGGGVPVCIMGNGHMRPPHPVNKIIILGKPWSTVFIVPEVGIDQDFM